MARSVISICNDALDLCPAGNIDALDDDDLGARACKHHFWTTLEDLLGEHAYEGAMRRVSLAVLANDRPGEWGYCYAMPADVAATHRVLPDYTASYVSSGLVLLEGQRQWTGAGLYPGNDGARFVIANDRIYTNMVAAVLEYSTYAVELRAFRPLFHKAFALELASRIVMPVLKDTKRHATLIGLAEVARQRAMADDLNAFPRQTFDFVSEEAVVRLGGIDAGSLGGYGIIG